MKTVYTLDIKKCDPNWESKDFSIYQIELPNGLDTDVSKEKDELGFYYLLVDSLIVKKYEAI